MEPNVNTNNRTPNPVAAEPPRFAVPAVDVVENKEEVVVFVDLPGVKKDDVSIRIEKDQLSIEARRLPVERAGKALVTEYHPLSLRRQFAIQQGSVEIDKVKADLQNGVLRLTLPKAARVKPRVIPVSSA